MHILLILWTLSYIDMIDIWTLHYGDLADWILSYIQLSGIGLRLVQSWLIFEQCIMEIWLIEYCPIYNCLVLDYVLYRVDWYLNTALWRFGWLNTVLYTIVWYWITSCTELIDIWILPIETWLVLDYCPIWTWWIFRYCPIPSLKNPHGFGDWICPFWGWKVRKRTCCGGSSRKSQST